MIRERIGFDRQPAPRSCECLDCGLSLPIGRCESWPRITVLPTWDRTPTVDAYGVCPSCAVKQETAFVPPLAAAEKEPQRSLFA